MEDKSDSFPVKKQLLLESIRRREIQSVQTLKSRLQEALDCIKLNPEPNGKEVNVTEQLYDDLLLSALAGDDWENWDINREGAQLRNRSESGFTQSESIYKWLLDQIHENDDIMFKYYNNRNSYKQNLHKEASWLALSMDRYRVHFINPTLEMLETWKGDKSSNLSQDQLDKAKMEFKKRVLGDGELPSWRYRSRMYWLLARFKGATIGTLVARLVQDIIAEDFEVILENKDGRLQLIDRADKDKKGVGILRFSSLLAYASAKDEYELVLSILQSKEKYERTVRYGPNWEENWKKALANALWNAAYKGNHRIVKELLKCGDLYSTSQCYNPDDNKMLPLHVAVRLGHVSVVDAFCAGSQTQLSCHEKDQKLRSPLEVSSKLTDEEKKWRIQSILLQRPEVRHALDESYRKRDLIVNSANAIMVGAALIAGVTFGGWLQPPLGFHTYYQFTEPLPAPPDTFSSYLSVQGHTSIRVFAIFNSVSFFFAVASMLAGIETFMAATIDETYAETAANRLLCKLRLTTFLFVVSVIFVLIAFGSAAIAILPPITLYQRDMYITIAVGGFFCIMFIAKMLRECFIMFSKPVRRKTRVSCMPMKIN